MTGVVTLSGSAMSTALEDLLSSNVSIRPGATPSYQLCKEIYLTHPLGAKLAEKPLELAQSQERDISIADSPEDDVKDAFKSEWKKLSADNHIFNTGKLSRVYGIASVAMLTDGESVSKAVDFWKLYSKSISFNVYDPLNTAGSLVLNQDPLSMTFQHVTDISVNGSAFHRSRSRVLLNGAPIYIAFNNASYGFVGFSIYQRSLYPLKSFIQSMRTDDLVAVKAGVIVAKIKQVGSIISNAARQLFGAKRDVVKEAVNGNVISIGTEGEEIESLNLQNLEGPATMARKNILENIATATPMPAKMVTQESLASTFSEGSEDAKDIARYVDRQRVQLEILYDYFDNICMHRAWNEEFYKGIQKKYDEYKDVDYKTAFYRWKNSFTAIWPSLLIEPESERAKSDKVKLEAVIELMTVLLPMLDPYNKMILIRWATDQFGSLKLLFGTASLNFDYDKLESYEPPIAQAGQEPGKEGEARGDRITAADAVQIIEEHLSKRFPRRVA